MVICDADRAMMALVGSPGASPVSSPEALA
jgi:hypothetical protein